MTIEIRGFLQFKSLFGGSSVLHSAPDGCDVQQLIDLLDEYYAGQLKPLIVTEDGCFNQWVRIMLNGRDVRFLTNSELILHDSDILLFMPAMAGG